MKRAIQLGFKDAFSLGSLLKDALFIMLLGYLNGFWFALEFAALYLPVSILISIAIERVWPAKR